MTEALTRQREALAAALEARLAQADAPLPELKELQDRLHLIDGVLASRRAAAEHRPGRLLAPMVVVAGVLTVAATARVPVVPVSLEVRAASATLGLSRDALAGPLPLRGRQRVEGATALESPDPGLGQAFAAAREGSFTLGVERGLLRALSAPAGADLTVAARASGVELRMEPPAAAAAAAASGGAGPAASSPSADFEWQGSAEFDWGAGPRSAPRDAGGGEWLRVTSAPTQPGAAAPPLMLALSLDPGQPARLSGLRPETLRFAIRQDRGGALAGLGSSLEGGTVTLPATEETVTLAAGDWLEADGLVAERCEVVVASPLTVRFNGSARSLRLRVGDFERSLAPTWLEYWAKHHTAKLFWGSAAVLWGAWTWVQGRFGGAR